MFVLPFTPAMRTAFRYPLGRVSRRAARRAAGVVLALGALAASRCIVTSGQVLVSFDLGSLSIPNAAAAIAAPIDLNTIGDYRDHRDDLAGIADFALLGTVTNHGTQPASFEFWMTPNPTFHTLASEVRADPSAVRIWGPLSLAGGETRKIDWDESAGLFRGRVVLIDQVKSDGVFTLYLIASTGTPSVAGFTVDQGVMVIVLDAKG